MGRMTAGDLNQRLYDAPFKPFRIHLSDGSAIPITASKGLVGIASAILPVEFGKDTGGYPLKRWQTVTLAHIVRFSDMTRLQKRPRKRA